MAKGRCLFNPRVVGEEGHGWPGLTASLSTLQPKQKWLVDLRKQLKISVEQRMVSPMPIAGAPLIAHP